jgi:5-methylcytosine-specific restriction endonuclease McrA
MVQVAEKLGRSHGAVKVLASKLEVRFPRQAWGQEQRAWTAEEDALIQELAAETPYAEIGRLCERSESSVKTRAHQLGARGRSKAQYAQRGAGHPNWRGGDNPRWRGEDWPEVRLAALERDGYACQDCGLFLPSGSGLVVHHVIPWRLRPVNEPRWLVTLCATDHLRRPEHWWVSIPEDVRELL